MEESRFLERGTPALEGFAGRVERAIRATEALNTLPYGDKAAIRAAWGELTGQIVDETFRLIPPVYSDHGVNIRVGRNVFINQGCRLNDVDAIEIGEDVMIGPGVSLITSGHPVEPALRHSGITTAPIRIERNVWIGASATILQGVRVGEDSVVAAGAVVTRDVPPATLVGGVPARVVRNLR